MILNGEIFNYLELKAELQAVGHVFRTTSDTEVLIVALHEWGLEALRRLIGMYAFILLDLKAQRLIIARDPFGIKPLYVARPDGQLAFASEIPALLDVPGVSRTIDVAAASLYLRRGVTDASTATLFADVSAFPAAHYAVLDLDKPRIELDPIRFWKPEVHQTSASFNETAERVRDTLLTNVALHLRSDVPIGVALSGGIDSNAIVAMARANGGAAGMRCFSFVAPGERIDETKWIEASVHAGGCKNYVVEASGADLERDLDDLVRCQGEPFGSSSIYAQYRVMRLAHDHGIKVMLDGQGADELFAGYRIFLAARISELLRHGRVIEALRLIYHSIRRPDVRLTALGYNVIDRLAADHMPTVFLHMSGRSACPNWLNSEWLDGQDATTPELRPGRSLHEDLVQALSVDVLPALLRYEDRNSMCFSIETRVPFLTVPMAEIALSCRSEHLVAQDGTTKAVLRRALRGLVPDVILDRRDKIGFETPERRWLSASRSWYEKVLSSDSARRVPMIKLAPVRDIAKRWFEGDSLADRFLVWRFLNFLRWVELFDVEFKRS